MHRHDRHNNPHGGVLIAVKNDFELTNIQKGKEADRRNSQYQQDQENVTLLLLSTTG